MRIRINCAQSVKGGHVSVEFESDYGRGVGIWPSTERPTVGGEYDVELAIDGILTWGEDLVPAPSGLPRIEVEQDKLVLQGQVETVAEEGVVSIRIGSSILLVEADYCLAKPGDHVRVVAKSVELYDVRL